MFKSLRGGVEIFFGVICMEKLDALKKYLRGLGNVAVAYSGGVDSTFLLAVAHEVLGEKVLALTTANTL